jgi:hypothetical protein
MEDDVAAEGLKLGDGSLASAVGVAPMKKSPRRSR